MASEQDMFKLSGPRHLTHVDWSDPNHRRCIAASLVQGVYVLEWDRQERRNVQAEMWWGFFNFMLLHPLLDRVGGSIFGAVYKWSKKSAGIRARPPGAPKIVVALRGNIIKPDTLGRDLILDFILLANKLHTSNRFHATFEVVKTSVHRRGCENVWIAGHSLGAAVALLAGRKMAEEEHHFLQAHLFNPPFVSPLVERIKNERLKCGFHIARSLVTAGLAMTLRDDRARAEWQKTFSVLRSWVPCLYVNPRDDVSSGYVGYFTNQQVMKQRGAGGIAKLAVQHSISDIVLSAFGMESKGAGHLIPCARLTVNVSPSPDFKWAHGIHQWWTFDIRIQCTEYRLLPLERLEETFAPRPTTLFFLRHRIYDLVVGSLFSSELKFSRI